MKIEKLFSKVWAKYWLIAICKLGMFSKPKELSMDVYINFRNR